MSQPIWKGPDSPAGHTFYVPPALRELPDCPSCKNGTILLKTKKDGKVLCADCKRWLSVSFLIKLGVIHPDEISRLG